MQIKKITSNRDTRQGFTLLEMVVSLGIFAVIIVSSIAVLLAISNAQQRVANSQNVQDNIRFALELMTKEIRQGTDLTGVEPCLNDECDQISITSAREEWGKITYCKFGDKIRRVINGAPCVADSPQITADNIQIEKLTFYVHGDTAHYAGPPKLQPRVTIVVQGKTISPNPNFDATFSLQTTVTQRVRNF